MHCWIIFLFLILTHYMLFIFIYISMCLLHLLHLTAPGMSPRGLCYSTWSCEDFPGVHNSSLMPLEQCCSSPWGLSWRNASDHTCLSCAYTLLPGQLCYSAALLVFLDHRALIVPSICNDLIFFSWEVLPSTVHSLFKHLVMKCIYYRRYRKFN